MKTTKLTMELRITEHENESIGTHIELFRDGEFIGTSELRKEEANELLECSRMIHECVNE